MEPQFFTARFEEQFPMIKIVKVDTTCYVYDAKSGMLAAISPEEINQIYNYHFHTYTSGVSIPSYLKDLLDKGVFLPGPLKRITPKQDRLDDIINSQIEGNIPRVLMLEITEECNLSCKYCFFSKKDGFKERKHTQNTMSQSIAYKAIDYYYQKYTNALLKISPENRYNIVSKIPPMMQWWGGEPFYAFDMILKTKSYFESLGWEQYAISKENFAYGLTSNLTIFNENILNFLVENNIALRVSLDGDEISHNKNRVYLSGKGSFEIVLKNLNIIIGKFPEYAKRRVGFQSVLADNLDIFQAQEFIEKQFNLNTPSNKVLSNSVSPQRKKGRFLSELELTKDSIEKAVSSFTKKIDEIAKKAPDEIEALFRYNKKLYQELKKILLVEDLLSLDSPKGLDSISYLFSCPIGADTMFVSTDGFIHCCAKTDYSFPFGHISTGINKERLKKIYTSYYNEIEKQCIGCWAYKFCTICPALTCYEDKFYLPTKEECQQIKKNALIQLSQYIVLTEKYDHLYSQIQSFSMNNFKPENDSKPINVKEIEL